MEYSFRNLVFEGGGVKGIAYVGALKVLQEKGILVQVQRVAGTSAGAINAVLLSLGYTPEETNEVLSKLEFKNFMDDSWGVARDSKRLLKEFGWYKGDFFRAWIGNLIAGKIGNAEATFAELKAHGCLDLYLVGTNLSTKFSEVYSAEHTPRMRVADAARISMSIPLFFASVKDARGDRFVDGGVLNNYPIKLFDREKYLSGATADKLGRETSYYAAHNQRLADEGKALSSYIYNKQTLGFRLDSGEEIAAFRDGAEPAHQKVDTFMDYTWALINTIMETQQNQHLHSDDWHRTVYIDTLGVKTTDFDLSDPKKIELATSGEKGTRHYFSWFDDTTSDPAINHPDVS
ncbi:MAG: patatin [Zetaproteobacteria bacterium CG_4_9_14_3_um_filter_49_83]|nr:MAG: patatin [Zetaproteobacteria bacterium CG1_02_49_23]PIQ31782.1 MAG: patatin [Zetaproteobacteria bacterium CG17_big_fil_post_rev_8_21_14_2_50_50_13]PIV31419.1 MAG: patatin [Zetaproteobacteria bacterium CG02_land_8_20_14_3_00_50_9]PIY56653.1 MAG: patatin [Zetaproteobacteria bacterium CG_4_10_14_0_8_um_filter_49_80]PJA34207.1 MAG: patatin [Zetaproteobacteria bacterium CG_4_9_14_3_um_filter_49_83]